MSIFTAMKTAALFVVMGAPLFAEDFAGDTEQGAVIYAERCARCHGVSIDMVVSPEDAPRLVTFLASHKIRSDPSRSDQDNADLAAYLVSMSPTQRN